MERTTCPICSDYFTVADCTACPCGHTFHFNCIKRWKVESSTCPQCRVKFKEPIKLYFEQNTDDTIGECDSSELKNQIRELKLQVKLKDASVQSLQKECDVTHSNITEKNNEIISIQEALRNSQGTNDALKSQLAYLEKFKAESQRARAQAVELERELVSYQNIKEMVKGERHDVESMMKKYSDTPDTLNTVMTSYVLLKREFDKMKEVKKKLDKERKEFRRKAEIASQEAYENQQKVDVLSNDLIHLNDMNKSLQQKLRKLEQSFTSQSPRATAIKRLLMESPAPLDLKRTRISSEFLGNAHTQHDGSMILFDENRPGVFSECDHDDENDDEEENKEDKEMLEEFGLSHVSTTSVSATNRNHDKPFTINKLPLTMCNNKTNFQKNTAASSSLPHTKKGFNGMGGQSKVLYIPKRNSGFIKKHSQDNQKTKTKTRTLKVPKSNASISKFLFKKERLPTIELSP